MKFSDGPVRYDFSGCDVVWFAQKEHDFGSFVAEDFAGTTPAFQNAGSFLRSSRWVKSGGRQSDVIAASWAKSIEGQASGVFMMQLKQDVVDWKTIMRAGDALLVFMSNLDAAGKTVVTLLSLVFVDRVAEGVTVDGSGATVRVTTVSARDVGKIFEASATVSDPAFLTADQIFYAQAFYQRLSETTSLSPTELVLNLIDILYTPPPATLAGVFETRSDLVAAQWRFPGNEDVPIVSLLDVSTFVQAPTFGYWDVGGFPFAESGSPWSLLTQYQNADVNEMFFDVRDVTPEALASIKYQEDLASNFVDAADAARQKSEKKRVWNNLLALGDPNRHTFRFGDDSLGNTIPAGSQEAAFAQPRINIQGVAPASIALVFRQRPYDTGSFFKLPVHYVDEREVVSDEYGVSDHSVLNFFRLSASTLPPQLQEQMFGIVVNKASIARAGLRRKEIRTLFPFATSQLALDYRAGSQNDVAFAQIYEYYVFLCSTWYAFNEHLLEGPISLHFRPDIRVGNRLDLLRRDASGRPYSLHFYIQSVRHTFAYDPSGSRTQLTLTRGIDSRTIPHNPAANLYWTDRGRFLPVKDPFDLYVNQLMRRPPNGAGSIDGGSR